MWLLDELRQRLVDSEKLVGWGGDTRLLSKRKRPQQVEDGKKDQRNASRYEKGVGRSLWTNVIGERCETEVGAGVCVHTRVYIWSEKHIVDGKNK
jgi:hypothetical protein